MNIIFDLDGTLICSKNRLHMLFNDITNSNLSFEEYWRLKYAGQKNQDILKNKLHYSEYDISIFTNEWMKRIETDHYLKMDMLIDGVKSFIENIKQHNSLYICTARQSIYQTKCQLSNLGIINYFDNIFITEQKKSKVELLQNCGINFTKNDWIIGDTGHDISTGKNIGIKTCAVLSGFMSLDTLTQYSPDTIVENITKIDFL